MVPDRKDDWLDWMELQNPDIVFLQELNDYTSAKLAKDAKSWNHAYSAILKEDGFPIGLTSRFPIENLKRFKQGFHHGMLRARIRGIYYYGVHLHPSNWEVRQQEMALIIDDIKSLPRGARIIIAGDFNTFSHFDSTYYAHGKLEPFFANRDIAYEEQNLKDGQLDYYVLDKLMQIGFTDSEASLRPDSYVFSGSFPTMIEKEGEHGDQRRLDYVFISENLKHSLTKSQIISTEETLYLSDHLPVIVDFQF